MKNCIFHLIKGAADVIPHQGKAPCGLHWTPPPFCNQFEVQSWPTVRLYDRVFCATISPQFLQVAPPQASVAQSRQTNPDHNAPTVAPPVRSVCSLLRSPILTPDPNVRYHFFRSDFLFAGLVLRTLIPLAPLRR